MVLSLYTSPVRLLSPSRLLWVYCVAIQYARFGEESLEVFPQLAMFI